jgi:hypothetical protein
MCCPLPPCWGMAGGAGGKDSWGRVLVRAGVRRWTRSDRTHTDGACVLTWDLILAPINLGPNSHWALAAIWPRKVAA